MNKFSLLFFTLGALSILGSACKSKKALTGKEETKTTPANPTIALVQTILNNQNDFSYYSATGQMNYKDENTSQELGVNIVMEKDQYLYANITAVLGITVARILATPDSLVILDLLHRKAIIANYDYVSKMTGADLRLSNLQNLIIGNTLFPNDESNCIIDSLSNAFRILQSLSSSISQKTTYTSDFKVSESLISQPSKSQELAISYQDVYTQGSNLFPSRININIRAEKNMESQLELKTFVFEKKKEIQFSVPKSYERIRL